MLREFLRAYLPVSQAYHQSKEQMAYSGATLYIGAAILFTVRSDSWKCRPLPDKILLGILLVLLTLIAFRFVWWQFDMRRIAAIRTTACCNLLCRLIETEPSAAELALVPDPLLLGPDKWPNAFVMEMVAVAKQPFDWDARGLPLSAMFISTMGAIVKIIIDCSK